MYENTLFDVIITTGALYIILIYFFSQKYLKLNQRRWLAFYKTLKLFQAHYQNSYRKLSEFLANLSCTKNLTSRTYFKYYLIKSKHFPYLVKLSDSQRFTFWMTQWFLKRYSCHQSGIRKGGRKLDNFLAVDGRGIILCKYYHCSNIINTTLLDVR